MENNQMIIDSIAELQAYVTKRTIEFCRKFVKKHYR